MDLFDLSNEVAVVIGGTGVLGGAFCDGLAGAGAHVVVSGRSEERGGRRVDAIVAAGGSASFQSVDGTNRESVTALRIRLIAAVSDPAPPPGSVPRHFSASSSIGAA